MARTTDSDNLRRSGPKIQRISITTDSDNLAKKIRAYFERRGERISRIHTTSEEGFQKIQSSGRLIAPKEGCAFSKQGVGLARLGTRAIRVKPSSEGLVRWITNMAEGDNPLFYPPGAKPGQCFTYVPTEHLEWFDVIMDDWVPFDIVLG